MLAYFGGVLSVALILFGIIMYWQTRDTLVPLTRKLSEEVLAARSDDIGRLIRGYLHDVHVVAARDAVRSGDRQAILAEMKDTLVVMNDTDYEVFFFADREGRFLATNGAEGSVADREYFQQVMVQGANASVSQPLQSRASAGINVFVAASPVINQAGERIGLIGATIMLETLTGIAETIKFGESGFGYVVGRDGLLIAHPSAELRMKLNLLDSARMGFVDLDKAGRAMMEGEAGSVVYYRPDGEKMVAVYHRIREAPGWVLGVALREDELMGPATRLMRVLLYLMAGIIAAVLIVVGVISRRLAAPIRDLLEGVKKVGSGALDQPLAIRTGDEIESLATAFNTMQFDLKKHIETLRRTTVEKERIEHDLHVANRIQGSMLPRTFPPFLKIPNLDLYATMEPAREVGGDFYDFFMVDERRLCFCIGDVSGKGVSAALFMVITRTILKNQALSGNSLEEIMRRTNDMLCAENEENMFVTVFMGWLDVVTGAVEYVCAGHNPPLTARRDGTFAFLPVKPGMMVGVMENAIFATASVQLQPGDILLLYTDGVTEAMNERDELFGAQRLFDAVNTVAPRTARTVIAAVRSAIKEYVQGTPASDDVTMLALGLTQ
jgi:sigma-B regulation protein RsbU (phosphoserine phosphatase)